ncbi:MAG: hypothetical protein ABIK86_07945, partial [candidate division WOR-3 bacterium]
MNVLVMRRDIRLAWRWRETANPMPSTPSGKEIKDGGWVVYDASTEKVYAAKGNKVSDFYVFEPGSEVWTPKTVIPTGREGKVPSKGAVGCADGQGHIYATKGNNTLGFYKYVIATDSWFQKADIPLGTTNKKVKGGTDLAYAESNDTGYVYLLKGYRNEFWRYNVARDSWELRSSPPTGTKYDKGSWLVAGQGP